MNRPRTDPHTTRAELAAIVCTALIDELGDSPVLVGGAVVAIYTEGRFVSDDLDIMTAHAVPLDALESWLSTEPYPESARRAALDALRTKLSGG